MKGNAMSRIQMGLPEPIQPVLKNCRCVMIPMPPPELPALPAGYSWQLLKVEGGQRLWCARPDPIRLDARESVTVEITGGLTACDEGGRPLDALQYPDPDREREARLSQGLAEYEKAMESAVPEIINAVKRRAVLAGKAICRIIADDPHQPQERAEFGPAGAVSPLAELAGMGETLDQNKIAKALGATESRRLTPKERTEILEAIKASYRGVQRAEVKILEIRKYPVTVNGEQFEAVFDPANYAGPDNDDAKRITAISVACVERWGNGYLERLSDTRYLWKLIQKGTSKPRQ